MQKMPPTPFKPQDTLGSNGEYRLLHLVPSRQNCWWTRGPKNECYLYLYLVPHLSQLSVTGQQRERKSVLRELDRWRHVLVARPPSFDHFWEGNTLCWVEDKAEGASLSSLNEPLSLYQGVSLLEECLCALELIHAERDFQVGDPLLHLNLSPDNIWRSRDGTLQFLHPLSPTMIELNKNVHMSDEEALSGERPPELLRGRYGMSSDLYSVGMSVLSAMTGLTVSRVDERLQADRLFTHDLPCPPMVAEFLTQLTAFRASARYQSAREALIALQALPSVEPLQPMYSTDTQQKASHPFSNSIKQHTLGEHELRTDTSKNNRSPFPQDNTSIVSNSETHASSTESRSPPNDFLTLAPSHEVGSIAAKQLGHDMSSSSGADDEVIVAVVMDSEWIKRDRLLIAICLLTLLFWIGSTLLASHPSLKKAIPPEQTNRIPKSRVLDGHLPTPHLSTDKLTQSKGHSIVSNPLKNTLLKPEIKSSPSPQWIKLSAGSVIIGSLPSEGYESEHPQHKAKVFSFEISKTEVTVLQYAQCVSQGICSTDGLKSSDWGDDRLCNWDRVGRADHPLNCVSWYQAKAYAQWVGGRLLSEVEWSFAAQGGSDSRLIYPWGDELASCKHAILSDFVRGSGCGNEKTSPVCQRPLGNSKQGVCDLIGNVWEWVMDEWHPNYKEAPLTSQAWIRRDGLDWDEQNRVYRGGGAFDELDLPRIARRGHRSPNTRLFNLGFRVARDSNQTHMPQIDRTQPSSRVHDEERIIDPPRHDLKDLRGARPDLP